MPLEVQVVSPERILWSGEAERVVTRAAGLMGLAIAPDGAHEIARRSRGTPRVAGRLLRRVRDFADVAGSATVTRAVADEALTRLEIDRLGLDQGQVNLLGIDIPHMDLPVRPGRDIARVIEVAALHTKLKLSGVNPAEDLQRRLLMQMNPRL